MEALLTPVGTSYKASNNEQKDTLIEVSKSSAATVKIKPFLSKASSPEEALEILRNEPDHETLVTTLQFLTRKDSFRITSPSPLVAQLVHVLVSDTVPTYWDVLCELQKHVGEKFNGKSRKKIPQELELLISCLRSVTGLKAVLLNIKQHIQQSKSASKAVGGSDIPKILKILLQLLQTLLQGNEAIRLIWRNLQEDSESNNMQRAIWQEFLSLVGSGKLVGIAAEAEDVMNEMTKRIAEKHWIAESTTYSLWLTMNIISWVKFIPKECTDELKSCGELLSKCLRLGYPGMLRSRSSISEADRFIDIIVKEILDNLLLPSVNDSTAFRELLGSLPSIEQRNFLYSCLKIASKGYLSSEITTEADSKWWQSNTVTISAVAGLINLVLGNDDVLKQQLLSWLTVSGAGVGEGIAIRRAAIAVLTEDKNMMELLLEKNLQQLSDKIYIRHTPILQQEGMAKNLVYSLLLTHL
jgi:telomere length regulation protein